MKNPSALLLLPLLVQFASAGGSVDAAPVSADADASAAASAAASSVAALPNLAGAAALGASAAPSLAAPAAASMALPAAAAAPAPALAAASPVQAAALPGAEPAAAAGASLRAAAPAQRAALAAGTQAAAPADASDGAASGRVRFDGQDAAKPADAAPVPYAGVPAYVTEYRRLVEKTAENERRRKDYMSSLPAGSGVRNELLAHWEESIAPEYDADNRALAALRNAYPNVEYESAGKLRRAGMRLLGRGPKKAEDAAPGKWVAFHGAEVPTMSFAPDMLARMVRAARVSVDMVVSEKDLTPGLIDALADAKKRNVALKIVGGPFSAGFMYSPVAERLRREGIVIHYKIGLSDAPMGVYDRELLVTGSYNYSAKSHEHAFVADDDRRRIASFDEALRAGWDQSPALSPAHAKPLTFNGAEFTGVGSGQAALIRAVDAAQASVDLSVTEKDVTLELIAALARAKARRIPLRIIGDAFSQGFASGPFAAELRRQGIVIHYKTVFGDKMGLLGVYDGKFSLRGSRNLSPAAEQALVADADPGRVDSFEKDFAAAWNYWSAVYPPTEPVK